ncbi:hypothetical protein AWV79_01730 [Cupriavidus sp. UYMMa02A]|nr:hypothetical protein AWV79_01730 [Cupriavidus sp. UYMMa02A]
MARCRTGKHRAAGPRPARAVGGAGIAADQRDSRGAIDQDEQLPRGFLWIRHAARLREFDQVIEQPLLMKPRNGADLAVWIFRFSRGVDEGATVEAI